MSLRREKCSPWMGLALVLTMMVGFATAGSATAEAADPTASFTYRMVDRYLDSSGDGFYDPSVTAGQVQQEFHVEFDACASDGGGASITSYRWVIDGQTTDRTVCTLQWFFATEGTFTVGLIVTSANGSSEETTKSVRVNDLLIVSIGDSIGSGEGNPYQTEYLINQDVLGNRVRIPIDATWGDERCHRSAVAGPAQAARHIEVSDPKTSVTFVHVACSGASIADPILDDEDPDGGLLHPYKGIEPPDGQPPLPPQLDQVKDLIGNRQIDALFISIGANDLFFSKIVKNCLINIFGCHVDHPSIEDAVDIFNDRFPLLDPLYDDLRTAIEEKLDSAIAPNDIYVTEYFDPTPNESGQVCDPLIAGLVGKEEARWASRTVVGKMNEKIAEKATSFGWNSVSGIVAGYTGPPGHGYCAEPHWVVRLEESLVNQADKEGSFHPCAQGHGAYRDSLVAQAAPRLGLAIPAPVTGKGIVTGVKCSSPPEHFGNNRDGDSISAFGLIGVPIPDVLDNCPNVPNADQFDADGNLVGDACQGHVVTSTGTTHEHQTAELEDGICQEPCTLHAAIEQSNYKPDHDDITFSIRGSLGPLNYGGTQTIAPEEPLPQIVHPVTIDGTTQPLIGAYIVNFRCAPFTGHPCIELSGESQTQCGACPGLTIMNHTGSTVRSLAINRQTSVGIELSNVGADCEEVLGAHTVEGNFIGTDVFGELDLGNRYHGIEIFSSRDNRIGGPAGWQRNVISGNGWSGVAIGAPSCTRNNVIQNNFIGTDVTGTEPIGNDLAGVDINAGQNLVGGDTPKLRNVISGNAGDGITFFNAGRNLVIGNYIGTQLDGVGELGNGSDGIEIFDNHDDEIIGGSKRAFHNIIAFNRENGIYLYEGVGHRILGNSIFDNYLLGIDIANCGVCTGEVTLNDDGDIDEGNLPNKAQNFPVVKLARKKSRGLLVTASLDSGRNSDYAIQFYASSRCDPSGHGEGKKYLGSKSLTTAGSGIGALRVTLKKKIEARWFVTATATDADGNTSEFSKCKKVKAL